ncbi:hypothetical protein [Streptomyces sp. NPDC002467]|uniref:hypothetical protein n=1 Tax=Streptomyces sp. NPDC002467 TaxID=3364647 RepID=UPI00369448EB
MKWTAPSHAARAGMAVLLLPLLPACSTGEAPGRPPAVRQLDDSKALKLPLDEYLLTTADLDVLTRGRETLVRQCLTRMGAQSAPRASGGIGIEDNERRYGLADAELAKGYGYHLPGGEKPATEYPASVVPLVNGEATTFNGAPVPEGGCAGEARRGLHEAELQQSIETPQRLNMESYRKSQQDPAVTEVGRKWSRCMAESGHEYPDPMSAINDREFSSATPGDHERQVALADVLCKQKVNLIGVWSSTESTYQQALIQSNAGVLAEHLLAKQKTMELARAAIGQ